MSDDKAESRHLPSFEERVLVRLDAIETAVTALQKKEAVREYDTKPMWEHLIKAFNQMRTDVNTRFDSFDRKLDVINKEVLQLKADQLGFENRRAN